MQGLHLISSPLVKAMVATVTSLDLKIWSELIAGWPPQGLQVMQAKEFLLFCDFWQGFGALMFGGRQ